MASLNRILEQLQRMVPSPDSSGLTDGQLLAGFVANREPAFEALVKRHGPMVMGVCQRELHDLHDAEDAFQATFLVLVRQASSIRKHESIASWLYGVAYRTATRARVASAKRRAVERQVGPMIHQEATDTWHELLPLLDQELSRLPDKYREPLVLCDLEGKTRKECDSEGRGWSIS